MAGDSFPWVKCGMLRLQCAGEAAGIPAAVGCRQHRLAGIDGELPLPQDVEQPVAVVRR